MEFVKFWIILDILFYLWALNKILYSQVAPENRVFKLILWGVFEVFSILVDWLWGRRYSMIFSDFMGRQFCPPSELCPEFSKVWCITSDVLTFDSRTLGTIVSESSATIKYVLSWSSLNEQELELKKFWACYIQWDENFRWT